MVRAPEVFEELFQKRRGDIRPGLDRIKAAYQAIGCPASQIPKVVIGGTNGKGSTLAFLVQQLERSGLSVGSYTSPHLVSYAERFWLNGAMVGEKQLRLQTESLRTRLGEGHWASLSFFEISVLLALVLCEAKTVDLIVLEVGLGGRWDATNIFEPIATAVVSVGIDHQEYLGETLSEILSEKLAINRPNTPFIWGGRDNIAADERSTSVLGRHLREIRPIIVDSKSQASTIESQLPAFFEKLPQYLQDNLRVSVFLANVIFEKLGMSGLKNADQLFSSELSDYPPALYGRFSSATVAHVKSGSKINLIIDVCHNQPGAASLVRELKSRKNRATGPSAILVSILRDKCHQEIMQELQSLDLPIVGFLGTDARSWKHEDFISAAPTSPCFSGFAEAWQYVTMNPSITARSVAVCGSVAAIGDVISYIKSSRDWFIESTNFH